jgi:L-ribulose-5-phosphate 4-epimerase
VSAGPASAGPASEHAISAAISHTRTEVYALHAALVDNNLVAWTSGNVSARVPGAELMVIKPSGVSYDDLTPTSMVVCDLSGKPVSPDGS